MTDTENRLPKTLAASVQLYLDITGDTPELLQQSLKEMSADAANDRFNQIMLDNSTRAHVRSDQRSREYP